MSGPFEALEDRLLRGGIAPRHVRRYLRELTEHLADLAAEQRAAGHDPEDDAVSARAALGSDEELTAAMLKQPGFRSLTARFPWLVFGVLPPLALLLSAFVQVLLFIVLAQMVGGMGHGDTISERIRPVMAAMQLLGNFVAVSTVALLFAASALRQRLPLAWPVFSTLVIAALSLHWSSQPWKLDPHGWGAAGISYRYGVSADAVHFGFTPVFLDAWWKALPQHGFLLAVQYLLNLMPLAWLLNQRKNAGA